MESAKKIWHPEDLPRKRTQIKDAIKIKGHDKDIADITFKKYNTP